MFYNQLLFIYILLYLACLVIWFWMPFIFLCVIYLVLILSIWNIGLIQYLILIKDVLFILIVFFLHNCPKGIEYFATILAWEKQGRWEPAVMCVVSVFVLSLFCLQSIVNYSARHLVLKTVHFFVALVKNYHHGKWTSVMLTWRQISNPSLWDLHG